MLRLPKILQTFVSFTRIFRMFKLALSTETLPTLEKLAFVNLCEYQWDRFLAAEVTVFQSNEDSNPR